MYVASWCSDESFPFLSSARICVVFIPRKVTAPLPISNCSKKTGSVLRSRRNRPEQTAV